LLFLVLPLFLLALRSLVMFMKGRRRGHDVVVACLLLFLLVVKRWSLCLLSLLVVKNGARCSLEVKNGARRWSLLLVMKWRRWSLLLKRRRWSLLLLLMLNWGRWSLLVLNWGRWSLKGRILVDVVLPRGRSLVGEGGLEEHGWRGHGVDLVVR